MNEEKLIETNISKLLKKSLVEAKFRIQQSFSLNVFAHVLTRMGFVKQINLHPYGVKQNAVELEKLSDYNDYFESRYINKNYKGWCITSLIELEKDKKVYPGILSQVFYNPDLRRNYIDVFEVIQKRWGGFFSIIYRDVKILRREIFEGKINFDEIYEDMKNKGYIVDFE